MQQKLKERGNLLKDVKKAKKWTNAMLSENYAKFEKGRKGKTAGKDIIEKYCNGRQRIPEEMARFLESETGIYWGYWTCDVEYKTQRDYELAIARAEGDGEEEIREEFRQSYLDRVALFRALGYRYERPDCGDYGDYKVSDRDFEDDETKLSEYPPEHRLTDLHRPGVVYELDTVEFNAMLQTLRDSVDYTMFKIEREKR